MNWLRTFDRFLDVVILSGGVICGVPLIIKIYTAGHEPITYLGVSSFLVVALALLRLDSISRRDS